jgi:hypothetical protein
VWIPFLLASLPSVHRSHKFLFLQATSRLFLSLLLHMYDPSKGRGAQMGQDFKESKTDGSLKSGESGTQS